MNILDHRILIPRSPELVWEQISDLSKNPAWQVDCQSISFISSRHDGSGTRWRYTTNGGREYVAETTAWYDGLGYEYRLVDGVPFRENKGRIRLQEIAEGTIVQWTFSYEVGGVLGGVRNAVSLRRQLESTMVDSLKRLWSVLSKQGEGDGSREAKSLMREALDYEARAKYRPRHPSKVSAETAEIPAAPLITEPAYSDEDTRPRTPVMAEESESEREPAFLSDLPKAESVVPEVVVLEDAAVELLPPDEEMVVLSPPSQVLGIAGDETQETADDLHRGGAPALPDHPVVVEIQSSERQPASSKFGSEPAQGTRDTQEARAQPSAPLAPEPNEPGENPNIDTAQVSIFELFGVPKPGDTQEMRAVRVPEIPSEAAPLSFEPRPTARRRGLRILLRRKRVKLRRPE